MRQAEIRHTTCGAECRRFELLIHAVATFVNGMSTLRNAGDWGVALTDSELCALVAAEEFVLAEVSADLGVAAMA